jgi:hypothetical protein
MPATTTTPGHASGRDDRHPGHDVPNVQVHVDYISADEPIHAGYPATTRLLVVKAWAQKTFVPNPPSDKTYYLNDDKTRHRFTTEEEQKTLAELGYIHVAHFRLNEEQIAGNHRVL